MSTSKKRKIGVSQDGQQLSAFASLRALLERNTGSKLPDRNHLKNPKVNEPSKVKTEIQNLSQPEFHSQEITVDVSTTFQKDHLDTTANNYPPEVVEKLTSFPESRGTKIDFPERPAIAFSTFKPNKKNYQELENGSVHLLLVPGERLVILGECDISICKGEIALLGANLGPSKKKHRVFAPLTHSLPVIRNLGSNINDAEIILHPFESGLAHLKSLSPLFKGLWADNHENFGLSDDEQRASNQRNFQILFSSTNEPQKSYSQPLLSPPEWNAIISRCSDTQSHTHTIMVSGPKSSGKSTFAKLLINNLLSKFSKSTSRNILLLDLDPGQPEYSPPGQLSLIQIKEYNFGTPYCHPIPSAKNKLIRSHFIGAVTPALNSELFMACALNLISDYHKLLSTNPNCYLIINTPGWILGTGLEILVDIIQLAKPTEVIYMSQDGPFEVVESLNDAAKSTQFFTLPSQGSENTICSSANLRVMQYMSYFHLDHPEQKILAWNAQPLTFIPPWEISYSGKSSGILGILCYGEQPPASLLADMINGSLLSIVILEDMAAVPGWSIDQSSTSRNKICIDRTNFTEITKLEYPLIVRSPENLPYFNPANAIPLKPENSHCIGLALIRGIDVVRQKLQILTPFTPSIIEEIQGAEKKIVLVHGKLETPGWAYTEESIKKMVSEKQTKKPNGETKNVDKLNGTDPSIESYRAELDDTQDELVCDIPWVERLSTSLGRGIGSRVWRVRRDLGKTGESGE